MFPKVCSIFWEGHGALIHSTSTITLAQTGAYSCVHTVHSHGHGANSQLGHDLPTELPSGHNLAIIEHATGWLPGLDQGLPGLVPVPVFLLQHSPLINARSSHTVQFFKVHMPTCPPADEVTILSVHQLFIQ